jgi:hypothetical protein
LNIGLHSQSFNSPDGSVSGSEITTTGLASAWLKLSKDYSVFRFAPGNYGKLYQEKLDLVVIEGWHRFVPFFIQEIRKINRSIKIVFWNLSFYGFNEVVKLDVDGYLCNSRKVTVLLNKIKPSKYVRLAADPEIFKPNFDLVDFENDITFLGMYHRNKSNEVMDLILGESSKYNLSIYGSGWGEHPVYKKNWKGKLPIGGISNLYNSSKIVLGMTEDRQRKMGMINNRVFEAMACGSFLISEYFPELEQIFGDKILYSKTRGDTGRHIESILNSRIEERRSHKIKCCELIEKEHSYGNRVEDILGLYSSL